MPLDDDDEIEITPAMIHAGVMALFDPKNDELFCSSPERIRRVYLAMHKARSWGGPSDLSMEVVSEMQAAEIEIRALLEGRPGTALDGIISAYSRRTAPEKEAMVAVLAAHVVTERAISDMRRGDEGRAGTA